MKINLLVLLTFMASFFFSCKKDKAVVEEIEEGKRELTLTVPIGFPYPQIPADNLPTAYRIALGRRLFIDPILSRDSSISCSSCHKDNLHFTDGLTVALGIDGLLGTRNAPSIINAAYQPYFLWDGGVPNLEQQVLAPIDAHNEMDFDVNLVVNRLNRIESYRNDFEKAYEQAPSVFALTRAIACYERTLFSGKSKFDEYQYNHNTAALSASEQNGMTLFFGERGECFHCHGEYNFTDNSFKNNGLYLNYADSGRARITTLHSDVGKFKVPSLRNIAYTAPYMHDGSLATLEDVVEHYNTGGKAHFNKSALLKPLNLTTQEKIDLVNFLKALSD